jgi:hypothetical protein
MPLIQPKQDVIWAQTTTVEHAKHVQEVEKPSKEISELDAN